MNEGINNIKDFIKTLCQEHVMADLVKMVDEQAGGKLYLVFPKLSYAQKDLHLYVEHSKELGLLKGGKLTCALQTKLGYDHTSDDIGNKIEVKYSSWQKKGSEHDGFLGIVELTTGAFKDGSVEQFFARHYPQAVSSLRPKTTERKNSDEENVDRQHRLIALLKTDPKLWETFTQHPESWEEDQKKVSELIKIESHNSKSQTAVKK